ncbi:MAG: lysophospholipid acyltransferase family protein [Calothrix sp. SM1_5_4]|nr:lysophospholipid acyltransferase family protein [Calothrix sp. SM1_5_4]
MFRRYVLPWLVWLLYRLWTWTWRYELVESEGLRAALRSGDPLIFAHWHGSELCIVPLVGHYRIATMTSTSKDGQLIDFVIGKLGGATSRGSSTRGGVGALKGLVRLVGQGYRASMAVDGPKGPLHEVKPGVFELSRLAKARIVPVGASASNAIVFEKSWNKAALPKPFAKVRVWFGEPWPPLTKELSPKDPALGARLGAEISNACMRAGEHLR